MTCCSSPRTPSRRGRTSSAWPAATDHRPWSPPSPHGLASPMSACPREPAITSRSISAWTATTWSARWTRSLPARSAGSTWPASTAGHSSTTRRSACTRASPSHPSTGTPSSGPPPRCCQTSSAPTPHPLDLSFTGPDGTSYPTAQMILVSNNPYQLAHAGGRGTRKRIDGGVLGIVTARITSAAEAAQFAALQAAGQTRRFAGLARMERPHLRDPLDGPGAARRGRRDPRDGPAPAVPVPAGRPASATAAARNRRLARGHGPCGSWPAPPPQTSPASRPPARFLPPIGDISPYRHDCVQFGSRSALKYTQSWFQHGIGRPAGSLRRPSRPRACAVRPHNPPQDRPDS